MLHLFVDALQLVLLVGDLYLVLLQLFVEAGHIDRLQLLLTLNLFLLTEELGQLLLVFADIGLEGQVGIAQLVALLYQFGVLA